MSKIRWKQTQSSKREFAKLSPANQEKVATAIAKIQKSGSPKCAVCDMPATVIRWTLIRPPVAQQMGYGPGQNAGNIANFCDLHDDHVGYAAAKARIIQAFRENKTGVDSDGNQTYKSDLSN
jgi:hypothetical protein